METPHGEGTGDIVLEKIHKTSNHKKHKSTTSLDFEYFPFCWQTSETNQNLLTSNYNQNKLIRQEKCRQTGDEMNCNLQQLKLWWISFLILSLHWHEWNQPQLHFQCL